MSDERDDTTRRWPARAAAGAAGLLAAGCALAVAELVASGVRREAGPLVAVGGAVTAAGLGDTLTNAKALTVFAPVNDAFAAIPEEDLDALLADEPALTGVLSYPVVGERLAPQQLAEGESFEVNGEAAVVRGNVRTANATVYLIDTVLMS